MTQSFAPIYAEGGAMPTRFLPSAQPTKELLEHRPGRPTARLAERGGERDRKVFLLFRPQEARDRKPLPLRDQREPLDPELLVLLALQPYPNRVHSPLR